MEVPLYSTLLTEDTGLEFFYREEDIGTEETEPIEKRYDTVLVTEEFVDQEYIDQRLELAERNAPVLTRVRDVLAGRLLPKYIVKFEEERYTGDDSEGFRDWFQLEEEDKKDFINYLEERDIELRPVMSNEDHFMNV